MNIKYLNYRFKRKVKSVNIYFDRIYLHKKMLNKPNAVFIWIPKNAGTSIYYLLSKYGCPKLKTLNLIKNYFIQKGLVTFAHFDYCQLVNNGYVSEKYNKSSFKFCFVRNPYERAVSLFFYLKKINPVNEFDSFLDFCRMLDHQTIEDIGLYNTSGLSQCNPQVRWIENIKIDFVGKVENFNSDLNFLFKKLRITTAQTNPRLNSTNHNDYLNYYCKESKEIVENYYRDDFLRFGYKHELLSNLLK
jgi:hypothetical protein